MAKILIASLKAGAGHLKAAEGVEVAFKEYFPKIEVKNVDLFDYSTSLTRGFYGKFYIDLVNELPSFYRWAYRNINRSSSDLRILSDRLNAQAFEKLILSYQPDVFIGTNFVPSNLATYWRKKHKLRYKVVFILTDFEAHPLLFDPEVDLFTVPTDEVASQIIRLGAKKERVIVTGLPIHSKFTKKYSRSRLFHKLQIENKKTISLFSGGFGMGPVVGILKELNNLDGKFQIIVVAGKNSELQRKLKAVARNSHQKIKVFGFIDNVEEIMSISNIIISKAGGMTVSESLAIGTPLIISNPIPGQEEANSNYLTRNLAAFRADEETEVTKIIENVFRYPSILSQMEINIKRLGRPNAALDIAQTVSKKFLS